MNTRTMAIYCKNSLAASKEFDYRVLADRLNEIILQLDAGVDARYVP